MAIPQTHKVFRRAPGQGTPSSPLPLVQSIEPVVPTPTGRLNDDQVLVKIKVVALNARDVLMLQGLLPIPFKENGIAAGDCSGEVVGLGQSVTRFKLGDRVSPTADAGNITGELEPEGHSAIGEESDGVLAEYGVFDERVLVKIPDSLSWEEAASIACAGTTAWNALDAPHSFEKNKTVLIQGTGGVSHFSLLIALAGGLDPIITSSSPAKLDAFRKKLGTPNLKGFNYRETSPADQVALIKRLTGGKGVDIVVNNSGPPTFPQDIDSLVPQYGTVSVVGFLGGVTADWNPGLLLGLAVKQAKLQGIGIGSRVDYENLLRFIDEKKINVGALLDENVFTFEESQAAFDYLASGKHVGKVLIRVG